MLAGILILAAALSAHAQVGQWVYKAHMLHPRHAAAAATGADGRIYVFGGFTPGLSDTCEVYDPQTDSWSAIASLPEKIYNLDAVTAPSGHIFVVGVNLTTNQGRMFEYDPASDSFQPGTDLPVIGFAAYTAAVGNDNNLILWSSKSSSIQVDAYNFTSGTWSRLETPSFATTNVKITEDKAGLVYLCSGIALPDVPTKNTWAYDDHSHTWASLPNALSFRKFYGAEFAGDGKLYVVGGDDTDPSTASAVNLVEVFDPSTKVWSTGPSMLARRELPATARSGGRLYVIGGRYLDSDHVLKFLDTVECYQPSLLSSAGKALTGTEGAAISGDIATFHDLITGETAANYTASIDWGDGTSTVGAVAPGADPDSYIVQGSHTYKTLGSYTTTIKIDDSDGDTTTVKGSASISNAPINGIASSFSASSGVQFAGLVAHFTDDNPFEKDTDLSATIDWGDGSAVATGTVKANNVSGFDVQGSKTYSSPGSYTFKVTVSDGSQSVSFTGTATVTPPAPVVSATTITCVEGALFSGNVGSFTDADPSLTASSFASTVDWGDGSSSIGFIASNGSGDFNVSGSHTYSKYGTYVIKVKVGVNGGSTATANGQVNVSDAPISAKGADLVCKGTNFSDTVATFSDANPLGSAGEFGATIVWGDGKSSNGTIVASGGTYKVVGSHSYAKKGIYTAQISVRSLGGSTAAVTTKINVGPVK